MCEEKILPPCGSQIHLTGTAEFLEEARNPGQFSYRMYYRGLGIRNRVTADRIFISEGKSSPLRSQAECFRAYATAVFQEICVPEDAGIFQAILLGDKSGLSEELRERFQDNGIAHILAVSGVKTLKLDIPLVPETSIKWALMPLHIAKIYILKLCLDEEIIPRCRFPCSRGYLTKCINQQKKQ